MNKVQREFKRQMDVSLKDLKNNNVEMYNKYTMQSHLDNPEARRKYETKEKTKGIFKKIFSISVIIIFLFVIVPLIYTSVSNANIKTNTLKSDNITIVNRSNTNPVQNKGNEIVNFLKAFKPYQDSILSDVKKKSEDTAEVNNKKLTRAEYAENLQVYDNRTKDSISKISSLNVPTDLLKYIALQIEGCQLLCSGYENEINFLKTNNLEYRTSSVNYYKLSSEKLKSSNEELIKVLNDNNIDYK